MRQSEKPSCVTICLSKDYNWLKTDKIKKNEKSDQRKKWFRPSPFSKGTRSYTDNNYNKPGTAKRSGIKYWNFQWWVE